MSNISNISIDEIIIEKKPRKPRMSKIVEKAVLLKQLSDRDLVPNPVSVPSVVHTVVPTPVLEAVESKNKVGTKRTKKIIPTLVVVEPVPTVSGAISKPTYTCELCNITFTSKTLFTRHPQTIRHKNKVKNVKILTLFLNYKNFKYFI